MKRILFLILLLLIPTATAISQCNSPIETVDVPCMIVTAWQYPNACSSYSVRIFNSNTTLLSERTLGSYGSSGRCNITFNYSTADSYLLNFSSGDSSSIIVKDENNIYYLYVVAIIVFIILLYLGYSLETPVFTVIAGMVSIVLAVNLFVNGFPNLTNAFLKNGIVSILAGIGMYLVIAPSLHYFENLK